MATSTMSEQQQPLPKLCSCIKAGRAEHVAMGVLAYLSKAPYFCVLVRLC